ncbi:hypothetical protein DASC09_041770 [Saccharomycopsis crataegensis]|uniref:Uncharacterized protein n=1 Tax=Saccharomycopsis crataegensis TaxID=43959 RepID=A0AAV5QPS3_9ASCO|nr:hypothetical protein DASC09_041770 [Saccharomycopsis crataegensis]
MRRQWKQKFFKNTFHDWKSVLSGCIITRSTSNWLNIDRMFSKIEITLINATPSDQIIFSSQVSYGQLDYLLCQGLAAFRLTSCYHHV